MAHCKLQNLPISWHSWYYKGSLSVFRSWWCLKHAGSIETDFENFRIHGSFLLDVFLFLCNSLRQTSLKIHDPPSLFHAWAVANPNPVGVVSVVLRMAGMLGCRGSFRIDMGSWSCHTRASPFVLAFSA